MDRCLAVKKVSGANTRLCSEAFEEDIGQHSWGIAKDLREYLDWLALSTTDQILDFGCGPAGPLTYVVSQTGVKATGVDINAAALASAQNRVSTMGLSEQIALQDVSEDATLPFEDNCFDAVISIDVVMHLPDRTQTFCELWRVLAPGGRFLFTDACIVNGSLSDEDIRIRSHYGISHFVPDGFNESALVSAGFSLEKKEQHSDGLIAICSGRWKAREKYKKELVTQFGVTEFEHEQTYLKRLVELYSEKRLLRYAYLVQKQ
jgi:SAM-dependent methyltransferase